MPKRHINIPVFIPHLGCPNMCVFCDQRTITGTAGADRDGQLASAERIIEECLASAGGAEAEIAFFGGSFTGIDEDLMISLLDLAKGYCGRGGVKGIRMSTRPDYISPHIISVLRGYPVTQVELGIQSMDDRVLVTCRRGHTAGDTERAVELLRGAGFSVGGQMMIGLPGADPGSERECARYIAANCGSARIYPTVVFRGTELCRMAEKGEYVPLTVEEAVTRSADVLEILAEKGVECLRIGLCESENLHSRAYYAGPNHPALGEMVYSELYYRIISSLAKERDFTGDALITVPERHLSKAAGLGRSNVRRLTCTTGLKNIKFRGDPEFPPYKVTLERI
jgi:histone acetyltransferase (RNA polymerase elongator complex component)